MATFKLDAFYEVREPIDSPCIAELRKLYPEGALKAYSLKYRHPRFKNSFSSPIFCVSFTGNGGRCSEFADSLLALDTELTKLYFQPITA